MNKAPATPTEIWDGLARLRLLAEDVAAREARLREARQRRDQVERRRAEAARAEVRERHATRLAQAESDRTAGRSAAEARHRRHVQRVREAQRNVRKAGVERIDAEEGKRKFELQREMLRATRERDAGLSAADAAHASFGARLHTSQATLDTLEIEARSLLAVYGGGMLRALANAHESVSVDPSPAEDILARDLETTLESLRTDLAHFRRRLLPRLSRAWPVWLIVALSPLLLGPALPSLGLGGIGYRELGAGAAAFTVVAAAVHLLGRQLALPAIRQFLGSIGRARLLLHHAREKSADTHRRERARLEADHAATTERCNAGWSEVQDWLAEARAALPGRVDSHAARALARNDALLQSTFNRLDREHEATVEQLKRADAAPTTPGAPAGVGSVATGSEAATPEAELTAEWNGQATPIFRALHGLPDSPPATSIATTELLSAGWQPPARFTPWVPLGTVEIDPARLLEKLASDSAMTPRPKQPWSLPLALCFPSPGSLLLEATGRGRAQAIGLLNTVVCRLLAASPPGRVAFTVFDPVGLGQSFAGLTHLADEAEHLLTLLRSTHAGALEAARERKEKCLVEHEDQLTMPFDASVVEQLAGWLGQLKTMVSAGKFQAAATGLSNWSSSARTRMSSADAALKANAALVQERRDLRGTLEALKVKAQADGLAEDAELAKIFEAAQILYRRPTAMAQARALVQQYQTRVFKG